MKLAVRSGLRSFQMLLTPICSFYASFVYGIHYANLASFPIKFEDEFGWNMLVRALHFLAFFVSFPSGEANLLNQSYYNRCFTAAEIKAVLEARLPPMIFGSILFASGFFVFW